MKWSVSWSWRGPSGVKRYSWGKPNINRTHCCALYIFPNMKPNYRTDSSYTYPFNHITISRQYRWEYWARYSRLDWGWLLLVVFYGKNSSWEDRSGCYGDIVRLGFGWKHWSEGFGKIVLANWGGVWDESYGQWFIWPVLEIDKI